MAKIDDQNQKDALPCVVYSHPYADWDLPSARHKYLMTAVSETTPVFYLNCAPHLSRLFNVPKPVDEVARPNLVVIRNSYGLRRSRWARLRWTRKIASVIDARRLEAIFKKHGAREILLWVAMPSEELIDDLKFQHLVYDCIDPSFNTATQDLYDRNEYSIAQRARLVFCTAQSLLERLQPHNARTFLIPNACCYEEYAPELNEEIPRPAQLDEIKTPIIGFSGHIDGRVDLELLETTVRRLSQYTFVFAGGVRDDRQKEFAPIAQLPNVISLNTVSVEENRQWVKAFDVGLIPFKPGEANDCLNTVKMWMYFAAGKPVVSTDLRESRLHEPFVHVAKNNDEFEAAIMRAVEDDSPSQIEARLEFARRNTWQHRADRVLELLHRHL